jgi:hypothetical protein
MKPNCAAERKKSLIKWLTFRLWGDWGICNARDEGALPKPMQEEPGLASTRRRCTNIVTI